MDAGWNSDREKEQPLSFRMIFLSEHTQRSYFDQNLPIDVFYMKYF